jgi:predicted regulator of Ras-like GTPase activity (Roadblock/LC7/MglB family)
MPLVFGQLIYTSFPKTGFQLLASQGIPKEIEQFFLEKIVHCYWDVYHPPEAGYRAVYLQGRDRQRNLFGWLYNRGRDDLGRSDIPYFLCYYLEESIEPTHLNYIFNCLQKGPLSVIDFKNNASIQLEPIEIANLWNYQPAAEGIEISFELQQKIHVQLQQNQLLNLFVPQYKQEKIEEDDDNTLQYFSNISIPNNLIKQQLDTERADAILQELISTNQAIKGAVLVSPEGQLLSKAYGIESNSALALAGIILYLAKNARDEFNDRLVSKITLQSKEGETISLLTCNSELFIMLKTSDSIDESLQKKIDAIGLHLETKST